MNIFKIIIIFFVSVLLAFFLSSQFANMYQYLYNTAQSSFGAELAVSEFILGFLVAYVFFLPLLLIGVVKHRANIIAIVLSIPVIIFLIAVDFSKIYFYIAVEVLGFLIGFGLRKLFIRAPDSKSIKDL